MKAKIINFFQKDQFAAHCGISLVDVEVGYALTEMEIKAYHLNSVGIVQGGALFTLADFAFAAACNSEGQMVLAQSAAIHFFKPGEGKYLYAEAKKISESRKTVFYEIGITDDKGDLIAKFTGTGFKKGQKLDL